MCSLMRSRLEARQGSSRASTDWAKLRASDLSVASHLDKTITHTGSDRLDQSLSGKTSAPIKTSATIEKARLVAPTAVTRGAGTKATQHGRELANPHGALPTGLPVPQRLNGASEGESGSVKLTRPGIVVIYRRAVFQRLLRSVSGDFIQGSRGFAVCECRRMVQFKRAKRTCCRRCHNRHRRRRRIRRRRAQIP